MSWRESVLSGFELLRKKIYKGPIKQAFIAAGIESLSRRAYSAVLGTISNDDIVTQEIDDVQASFRVTTGLEVQRFRSLMDEYDVLERVLHDIRPNDVFYDVGANVGLYTCFVAPLSAHTVAFEPHPANVERLQENINLNDISNTTVRQEALSNSNDTAELVSQGTDIAGEGTHAIATGLDSRSIEVDTIRGDSLPSSVPDPDVIKIDVEGAEMEVLEGLSDVLEDCAVVYCELHLPELDRRGHSPEDIYALLEEHGFATNSLTNRGEEEFVHASKRH